MKQPGPTRIPRWFLIALVLPLALVGLLREVQAQDQAPPPQPAAVDASDDVAVIQTPEMSFLELLEKGGLKFMIPIGLCSLLGLSIIIERLISLRRSVIVPPRFMDGLKQVFRSRDDAEQALTYCRNDASPVARIMAVGIRKLPQGEEAVEQAIEDAGANEVSKLRRNLRMLYGVSAVTPMLGLLGTVWGMIEAFQVVEAVGVGRASMLAKGIYEALVTTFAGLTVAIPCLVAYYFFLGRIDRIVSQMNDISEEFIEHFIVGRSNAAKPSTSTGEAATADAKLAFS